MIADDIDVNRPLDHFGPTWIFEEIFTIARAHTKLTQQKNYKALKTTRKQINTRKRWNEMQLHCKANKIQNNKAEMCNKTRE